MAAAPSFSRKFGVPWWISPLRMLDEFGVAADDQRHRPHPRPFRPHGLDRRIPEGAAPHPEARDTLSWMEAMALPRQFGFITAVVHPDDLRTAFDASLEHRADLIEGDNDNVLPGIHVRIGRATRSASSSSSSRRARAASSSRATASTAPATSSATTTTASTSRSAPASARLGAGQDHRPHQRDRRRHVQARHPPRLRPLGELPVVKEVEGFRVVEVSRA